MAAPASEPKDRYIYASGSRPLDGYTIKRAVGRGGFGEVYYATSDAGKEVALKLILRNLDVERRGVVQCMNLKSHNLITIFDLKTNPEGDCFVVMEYVAGASLANVLAQHPTGLPIDEVRAWMKGLIEGVAYLHDHGIVHRDLKPANLFMEEGVVKIGDYGLSKALTSSQHPGHSESVGTCHYMAPEISTGKYTKAIDIYAIGVIFYELLTGTVPFDGESVGEVLMKHLTARPDLSALPEPYRAIITRALAKDPNHRPKTTWEMLPPDDGRRPAEVRFVNEAKPQHDDILRIEDDSVFYIGPNTWPTRQQGAPTPRRDRRMAAGRPQQAPRAVPMQPVAMARPAAPPPRRPATPPPIATRPVPPMPTPPGPLPSGRLRVAELATSMLSAAPLSALAAAGALAVGTFSEPWIPVDPQQVAAYFGVVLLAVWGVLANQKRWEGKTVANSNRRFGGFAIGALIALALMGLQQWTHLDLGPGGQFAHPRPELARYVGPAAHTALPGFLETAAYFGATFGLIGWWKQTSRDRKNRFRILPVIVTGLVATTLAAFWPEGPVMAWGPPIAVATAVIAQVVSPWDRQAAAYALWARKAKVKTA